jgi:hypothetical protein
MTFESALQIYDKTLWKYAHSFCQSCPTAEYSPEDFHQEGLAVLHKLCIKFGDLPEKEFSKLLKASVYNRFRGMYYHSRAEDKVLQAKSVAKSVETIPDVDAQEVILLSLKCIRKKSPRLAEACESIIREILNPSEPYFRRLNNQVWKKVICLLSSEYGFSEKECEIGVQVLKKTIKSVYSKIRRKT